MKLITQKRPDGIDLENIQPADVDPFDIAHALARLPRFGGHAPCHYSVAEHSIRVASVVPERFKLEALLHDATEAYLGDVVAPLKQHLPQYQQLETMAHKVIARHFGIPRYISEVVQEADQWVLRLELHELFGHEPPPTMGTKIPERLTLAPEQTATFFLAILQDLMRS